MAGISGHLVDLYTFNAVFVLEVNELWFTVLAIALLIDSVQYYNHAIREILVVFASFTNNEQLASQIAVLFTKLDPLAFKQQVTSIYTSLIDHLTECVNRAE